MDPNVDLDERDLGVKKAFFAAPKWASFRAFLDQC